MTSNVSMNIEENAAKIKLNTNTIKVNPENYLAMTHGYYLPNQVKTKSTIYIADCGPKCNLRNQVYNNSSKNDYFLMTIDVGTEPEQQGNCEILHQWYKEKLCDVVKHTKLIERPCKLEPEFFTCNTKNYKTRYEYSHFKYIIHVDQVYNLSTDREIQKKLFEDMCTNGLFNQWDYTAPCNRLTDSKCHQLKYPEILLFRVFKIQNEIPRTRLITYEKSNSRFWDTFRKDDDKSAFMPHPVIPNDDFKKIKNKLEETLEKHKAIRTTMPY